MDDQTEKRGLYLEWDRTVSEAIICLVQIANDLPWRRWEQHRTDTRGIVTERAANAITKELASMHHDLATSEGLWCVDHQPENEPHAFRLTHKSIRGTEGQATQ